MKIRNTEDLLAEKMRLESNVVAIKAELRAELREVKEIFNPLTRVMKWFSSFHPSSASLVNAGANAGIDVLVRDKILSKSNWLVRTTVPFILKQLSNLFIGSGNKN